VIGVDELRWSGKASWWTPGAQCELRAGAMGRVSYRRRWYRPLCFCRGGMGSPGEERQRFLGAAGRKGWGLLRLALHAEQVHALANRGRLSQGHREHGEAVRCYYESSRGGRPKAHNTGLQTRVLSPDLLPRPHLSDNFFLNLLSWGQLRGFFYPPMERCDGP